MASTITEAPARDDESVYGTILPRRETYPGLEMSLTMHIVMAGRRWRSMLDEHLRDKGYSASRMEALAAIAYLPAASTQIQVAKRIGIEGPTLTRTLDMLEADGLVERLADPRDRRNKHMRMTQAGCEALADMFDIIQSFRKKLLAGIPTSDISDTDNFLEMLIDRINSGACDPAS